MRWQAFLRESIRARDWFALCLSGILLLIGGWLLAMPFCPPVQRSTIDRFHLATPSFGWWAVQQAIPAMYNLENRYWIAPGPPGEANLQDPPGGAPTGYLNHFPARIVTFADSRARWLIWADADGKDNPRETQFYCLQSVYQDSARCTWLEVRLVDGQLIMRRLEAQQ